LAFFIVFKLSLNFFHRRGVDKAKGDTVFFASDRMVEMMSQIKTAQITFMGNITKRPALMDQAIMQYKVDHAI